MPQYGYDDFVNELRRYPKSPTASKGKRLAHQSILNWSRESEDTKSLSQRLKERRAIEAEMKLLSQRLDQLHFVSGEMSQALQAPSSATPGHSNSAIHSAPTPRSFEPHGNHGAPKPSGNRPLASTQGERVVVQWVPIEPLRSPSLASPPPVRGEQNHPHPSVETGVSSTANSEPTTSNGKRTMDLAVDVPVPGEQNRWSPLVFDSAPRSNATEVRLQLHGLQGRLHHYMILLEELEREARDTLTLEGLTPTEVERILALRLGVRREQEALGHREAVLADADLRLEVLLELNT